MDLSVDGRWLAAAVFALCFRISCLSDYLVARLHLKTAILRAFPGLRFFFGGEIPCINSWK